MLKLSKYKGLSDFYAIYGFAPLIQNAIILWNYLYITKKLQQAPNKKEKENILQALKNSSIVYYNFLNFFGTYDFTSYSKRVYNLIAIDEEKGFIQPMGSEN